MLNAPINSVELEMQDQRHSLRGWADLAALGSGRSEILVHAEGAYVTDSEGNRLLDGMGGVWCVNVGYGREEIAQAIMEQARQLPFACPFRNTTNPPAARLSAKLADLAPGDLNRVVYSGGGSTANDSALRIVQHYFNHLGQDRKKQVLCRSDAYHGSTSVSAALSGMAANKIGFDMPDIGVNVLSAPYVYRRPDDTSEEEFCDLLLTECRDVIEHVGAENIACFFAEPIMGMAGVIVPPHDYLRRISKLCHDNDILVIADEVVTGFGRLGEYFSSDAIFGMSPDIVTCAKGLTSGYQPLGATIVSDRIFETIRTPMEEGALFTHGFTYSEHPICCAAALANIAIMEHEDLPGHVRTFGSRFREALSRLRDLPLVGEVRGMGFMHAIECVADRESKALLPPEARIGERIATYARREGLIVRPLGHLSVLSPPLVLGDTEIDFVERVLRKSISMATDELVREGVWCA